ncbi:alkaline phosphatase family protein [Oricola thermophila]|uniref:Alkaline phosphatase family protein n=1 Tax=Oricola thermophila TaxID=2742145 RepID=A0A6N1V8E5_9HYPH|nr:alkaline phosphatase family protein [Oricola thermophila]QKV17241.1 alkaline phosphatase family protein [Oricola thermophila]
MSRKIRNILFIMFDQLRWDYLSCAGHKTLHTPHIDRLASKGVRFSRAYVQSPICGSSRMSFYTGRYVHSHGAQRNNFPLKVGEMTLGDHLRASGMDAFLVGKTHMEADAKGLERLGIAPDSIIGARLSECGFDVFVRDDGLWAEGPDGFYDDRRSPYNEYLKSKGYPGENPWADHANASITDDGMLASGWLTQFAQQPANIREEDSETPWLTTQCIDFLQTPGRDDRPWLCHLSYIKPHWPYIVPAPYAGMYGPDDIQDVIRDESEKRDPHPVYDAYMQTLVSTSYSREGVRDNVIPAYMALIKQCDDQMGRLFAHLEETGRMDDTLIVLTSDHGDYLGDHWLGEKNFFHEQAVKIPLIVYDPRPEADATRGTVCDALVEAIDLAPTFLEAIGAEVPSHILEGRSLMPFLHGREPEQWRDWVICEFDYSTTPMATKLGLAHRDARAFMIFDGRWKMIHFEGGFEPMLFDLETDPEEFRDRRADPECAAEIERLYEALGQWARRLSQRTAISDAEVDKLTGKSQRRGVLLGLYDGAELPEEMTVKLRARPVPDFRERTG